MRIKNKKEYTESGFGANTAIESERLLNKDGSFNVKKTGLNLFQRISFFHTLITMSWLNFFLIVLLGFILFNLVFASVYMLIGLDQISGINATNPVDKFLGAFFFSTQTLTTVGYGKINPTGSAASAIAAFESMVGLLGFAFVTGLLYGRFARPTAKIVFSKNALISPYGDQNALMFRLANAKYSQMLNMEAIVILGRVEMVGASTMRKFYQLPLEMNVINMLATTWTIVHPIDKDSPIYGMDYDELVNTDTEIMVMLQGVDESYFQNLIIRTSYTCDEIVWGAKFLPVMNASKKVTTVAMDKLGDFERVDLPSSS